MFFEEEMEQYQKVQPVRYRLECKDGREFIGLVDNHYGIETIICYDKLEREVKALRNLLHKIETAYVKSLPYMDRKVRELALKTIILEK